MTLDVSEIEAKAISYWKRLAKEKYGIDYEISFNQAKGEMQAIAEGDAQLKQFGSGTQGLPAGFWFEKLKNEFNATISSEVLEKEKNNV